MRTRKVKYGKGKDYCRNAKLFTYPYIIVNHKSYAIAGNGWDEVHEHLPVTNRTVNVENKTYRLIGYVDEIDITPQISVR